MRVVVNVQCPGCPAEITFREDTGKLTSFRPNQPLRVRRVPGT